MSWTKTGSSNYTMRGPDGKILTNTMELHRLRTDTLSVLDKNTRTIYLLADCVNANTGASGSMTVLKQYVGKDFYITNPYSFVSFIDDTSKSGDFVNVNGSYILYLEEFDKTYLLDGIRGFGNWGANNITAFGYAPENTFWYRDVENKRYGVIKKGNAIDYDIATTEAEGDDLIVKLNDVKTYRLPGYYTVASFSLKPVVMFSSNANPVTTSNSGCISGNCTNGWGKYQYEGGYYDGFWTNGKKQGYGLYKWDGIGKYIGNWENDTMSGYGAYIADNDDNVVGEYRNGKLNGRGYTVVGDTWSYGWFTDGNLTDTYSYYKNDVSVGCTSGDCQNKYGYYVYSNGDYFAGFFKNGKKYLGTYTFADGNKYSGMFNTDEQYHGTGRFFFVSGAYYGGEWRNGKYHGRGYYHNSDLVSQIGEWSDGTLVKKL
jgi:hypothetical protein